MGIQQLTHIFWTDFEIQSICYLLWLTLSRLESPHYLGTDSGQRCLSNSLEVGYDDCIPGLFNDVHGIYISEGLPEFHDCRSVSIINCFYKPGESPSKIICLEGSNEPRSIGWSKALMLGGKKTILIFGFACSGIQSRPGELFKISTAWNRRSYSAHYFWTWEENILVNRSSKRDSVTQDFEFDFQMTGRALLTTSLSALGSSSSYQIVRFNLQSHAALASSGNRVNILLLWIQA
jgi:hypothetical protein